MRRGSDQKPSSPSKNAAHLMSTMNSATANNARVRSNTHSIRDKVESARRHLKSHQEQFHTGEDSSSGESIENKSPHHLRRSRSSPRGVTQSERHADREKHTSSVLYSAELQHARRVSGEARRRSNSVKKTPTTRASPAKSISPARHNTSFHNQSMRDLSLNTSPRRRSTYVVGGKNDSFRADATFTTSRRETFTIDRRDQTTVSHDATVIAPGLLDEEFHPRKPRVQSHGSSSVFHAKCAPKDMIPHEVSNPGKWEIDFLPGSLINAKKVEKDRRSAAFDLVSPNSETVRYQEERTRREEEQLRRLVHEQTNGRSTKEIFDSWVPLDEERRKRKGGQTEGAVTAKKSTRRLWESEETQEDREMLRVLGRREKEEGRRVVMEDDAGYAMPLPTEVVDRPLRTPSPIPPREPTPEEQFFTPATSAPRLSRVSGVSGVNEKNIDGETPIVGRHSARFTSTFVMDRSAAVDRSVRTLRGGADSEADRSGGSSFHGTPDRREESIEGRERSMGEYATPIGRREAGRRDEEERSFLNTSSHDRSRGALNESMRGFETSINRSLDHLSLLASRLTSSLETSKANLTAIAAPMGNSTASPLRERGRGL
ncbi:hypothetical protein PMAYCL1PPCAC_02442, partial [Pristionchus mayeri]